MSKFTGMFAKLKGRGLTKAKDEQTDDLQGFPKEQDPVNREHPIPFFCNTRFDKNDD